MNDTVLKIRNTEDDCRKRIENETVAVAEELRQVRSECDARLTKERESCRAKFEKGCAEANAEAQKLYAEAEEAAFAEAETFVRTYGSKLPEAVRFIVGGIIEKWR